MVSFVGIDVSSRTLDIAVRPQSLTINVTNDRAGFEVLEKSLRGLKVKRVLLEATGGYEREVLSFLQSAGYKV
ncbi:IS110 family transposase, partial [Pseudomonas sp. MH2]|nr:IS110 family transposase [Pseudomonas sp. MH2]